MIILIPCMCVHACTCTRVVSIIFTISTCTWCACMHKRLQGVLVELEQEWASNSVMNIQVEQVETELSTCTMYMLKENTYSMGTHNHVMSFHYPMCGLHTCTCILLLTNVLAGTANQNVRSAHYISILHLQVCQLLWELS